MFIPEKTPQPRLVSSAWHLQQSFDNGSTEQHSGFSFQTGMQSSLCMAQADLCTAFSSPGQIRSHTWDELLELFSAKLLRTGTASERSWTFCTLNQSDVETLMRLQGFWKPKEIIKIELLWVFKFFFSIIASQEMNKFLLGVCTGIFGVNIGPPPPKYNKDVLNKERRAKSKWEICFSDMKHILKNPLSP